MERTKQEKWYPIYFCDVPASVVFRTGPSVEHVQYTKNTKKSSSATSSNGHIFSVFNSNEIVYVLADWRNPVVHYTLCIHRRRLDRCIQCIHPPAATHPSAIREAKKRRTDKPTASVSFVGDQRPYEVTFYDLPIGAYFMIRDKKDCIYRKVATNTEPLSVLGHKVNFNTIIVSGPPLKETLDDVFIYGWRDSPANTASPDASFEMFVSDLLVWEVDIISTKMEVVLKKE